MERFLKLQKSGYSTRTETFQGRKHLVVPVVALMEGAVQAMMADTPEFVAAEELLKSVGGWDGRPVFGPHPTQNGYPVSGTDPATLEKYAVGQVFNARMEGTQLHMEAWVDVERCAQVDPALLRRLQAGEPIEVSVGTFCQMDPHARGQYRGKSYSGAWKELVPVHLALLPEGTTGACSREMGCGVRAAQDGGFDLMRLKGDGDEMKHMYSEWLEPGPETDALLKTLRNIPQSERDQLTDADFAGKGRSFPIEKPADVAAAAHAIGRAGSNNYSTAELQKRIVAIAYRKGGDFVAQLPESWKKKKDQKNATAFSRLVDELRELIGVAAQAEDADPNHDCGCKAAEEKALMDKKERVKALIAKSGGMFVETDAPTLEAASDEQLTRFEAAAAKQTADLKAATDSKTAAETAVAAEKTAREKAETDLRAAQAATKKDDKKEETKAPTFDELLKTASAETQALINSGIAAGKARKADTIKALKDAGVKAYSDAEFEAMSQDQLDRLSQVAKVEVKAATGVDFSARGQARTDTGAQGEVPEPPSLNDRIKTARSGK